MKPIDYHRKHQGMIEVTSKVDINSPEELALAYTPGVADAANAIAKDESMSYEVSSRFNKVAIISDGSAVLGLGNIGARGALPVMDGKAVLFRTFAGISAVPIVLGTQDKDEIISIVKGISHGFAGINIEDIAAPKCFEILDTLDRDLDIPVFHDDQHGTAIVVLAALINASKVLGKSLSELTVVLNGAGAAGNAIANILLCKGYEKCNPVRDLIVLDSKGIIHKDRFFLTEEKKRIAEITNRGGIKGGLKEALVDADVFIGVSKGNILSAELIKLMKPDPIIFALANPIPEIMPDAAKEAGASIVATGRSDFPNQVNNALVFPGLFRAALDLRHKITADMHMITAQAIADTLQPSKEMILPSIFDRRIVANIVSAIKERY